MSLTKRNVYKAPQQRDFIGLGGVCSSFLTRGFCNKYNCNYLHKIPVCKYFQSTGGCWKGDKCRYKHIQTTQKLNTTPALTNTLSKLTIAQMATSNPTSEGCKMENDKTTESHLNPFREWIHTSKLNPYQCKPLPSDCPSPENPFRVGMKLEAVDRQYQGLFCVASIIRVKGDELLIYFDGWSKNYNYWCRFNSPEIRPIYTCEKNHVSLQPPNRSEGARDQWNSGNGDWESYLANTGSSTLPAEEFSPLFLPQSGIRVFALSELSARVLLFYRMDTSKLPSQLHKRMQNSLTCSKCETTFLVGWISVCIFTCQEMLTHSSTHKYSKNRAGILCSQKCAALFSTDFSLTNKYHLD